MPIQQFFSFIMVRTSLLSMGWWWGPLCTNMLNWIFIVLSSLKQQSACRHVAPLGPGLEPTMMMMIVITTPKVKMNLHKIQLDVTYKCLIKWIINIDKQIYKSILNKLNTYFWVGLLNYCGSVFKKVKHEDCIYIYDISVFPTWHLYLWHQCFSDMTSIFMTSVFFTWHLHLWDQCISHVIKWKLFHLQMDVKDNELIPE